MRLSNREGDNNPKRWWRKFNRATASTMQHLSNYTYRDVNDYAQFTGVGVRYSSLQHGFCHRPQTCLHFNNFTISYGLQESNKSNIFRIKVPLLAAFVCKAEWKHGCRSICLVSHKYHELGNRNAIPLLCWLSYQNKQEKEHSLSCDRNLTHFHRNWTYQMSPIKTYHGEVVFSLWHWQSFHLNSWKNSNLKFKNRMNIRNAETIARILFNTVTVSACVKYLAVQ